jgi:haloalkane dehalogenase
MGTTVDEVIAAHRAAGRSFEAAGLTSFVRAEGEGEPIVLLHGLPSSSFLYRKVIGELAARGFAAMSFDLPGLGLADRPVDFDFTFAGLGRFAEAAVDALGLDRFHLVVHDAGGPVGFELAASAPERVRSLTILNTVVAMDAVPFPMEIYARLAAQRGWAALPPPRSPRRSASP